MIVYGAFPEGAILYGIKIRTPSSPPNLKSRCPSEQINFRRVNTPFFTQRVCIPCKLTSATSVTFRAFHSLYLMSTRASSASKRNSDTVGGLGAAPKRLKPAAPLTPSKKAVDSKTALETTPKKNKGPVMALEEPP